MAEGTDRFHARSSFAAGAATPKGDRAARNLGGVIPLARIFDEPHGPSRSVAFGRDGSRSLRDLASDSASLASRLRGADARRMLLHCEDAYAFAAGLLAAARAGVCAVLPPSRPPGALERIAGTVDAVVVDGADVPKTFAGRPCFHPLGASQPEASSPLPLALDRDRPWLELFTSGTTRGGRPVTKAVRHLEDEVMMLEKRFGALVGPGTRVLATVSPQHLYGLLFRVLWPLSTGRPFLRTPVLHPEELAPYADAGASPCVLATTPMALRHLAERLEPEALRSCRAVFSSGGPLAAEVARRVRASFGLPVWEIYGSTETGGIAARHQLRGEEAWRPLPEVEVERDPESGCLIVTSAFVSTGQRLDDRRTRFRLGDRVELEDNGCFRLLGRADRVVKIADKRLSLPEMEVQLSEHPYVRDAALVALERTGEPRLGAVVVLAPEGQQSLERSGRRKLLEALGEHLSRYFDRVLLPRTWRLASELPRNAQGKISAEELRGLFEEPKDTGREAQLLTLERDDSSLEAVFWLPEKLAFVEGHFPSRPVVPGVAQVHWAMSFLGEVLNDRWRLQSLDAIKFRELLTPGRKIRLRLEIEREARRFRFAVSDAEDSKRLFCDGRGMLEFPA